MFLFFLLLLKWVLWLLVVCYIQHVFVDVSLILTGSCCVTFSQIVDLMIVCETISLGIGKILLN